MQFFFGVYLVLAFLTDLFHCSTSTEEELKHKIAQTLKKVIKKILLKENVIMERREKKNKIMLCIEER